MFRKALLSLFLILSLTATLQVAAAGLTSEITLKSPNALAANAALATLIATVLLQLRQRKTDSFGLQHRHLRVCRPLHDVAASIEATLRQRPETLLTRNEHDHQIELEAKTPLFSKHGDGGLCYRVRLERESQNASQVDLSVYPRWWWTLGKTKRHDQTLDAICNALNQ